MLGFAAIRKDGFPDEQLDRKRWLALIGEFTELRRVDTLTVGSERYDYSGSAELLRNGERVGMFIWERGQVCVDGPYSMFTLAQTIAEILDARVFDVAGDEMLEVPADDE